MAAKAGGALLALGGALFARKNSRSGEYSFRLNKKEEEESKIRFR